MTRTVIYHPLLFTSFTLQCRPSQSSHRRRRSRRCEVPPAAESLFLVVLWVVSLMRCSQAVYPKWGLSTPQHTACTTILRPAPSMGSAGLAGVFTRPAGLPHPWGATSCRAAAPLTYMIAHHRRSFCTAPAWSCLLLSSHPTSSCSTFHRQPPSPPSHEHGAFSSHRSPYDHRLSTLTLTLPDPSPRPTAQLKQEEEQPDGYAAIRRRRDAGELRSREEYARAMEAVEYKVMQRHHAIAAPCWPGPPLDPACCPRCPPACSRRVDRCVAVCDGYPACTHAWQRQRTKARIVSHYRGAAEFLQHPQRHLRSLQL